MKKIFIIIIFFHVFIIDAQTSKKYDIQIADSSLNVPTLQVAIDKALKKSPLLKSSDIDMMIKQFQLRSVRKEWLDNFGVESFYKYGSIDNVNIQNINNLNQVSNAKTTDTRYSLGVYFKMSFFSFLNQKTKNNIAKQEIEKSKYERQLIQNEIVKLVVKQYNAYLLDKQLLSVKNKAYVSTQMQVSKAERDYKNGNLTIYELTKVMESSTKAEADYLLTKMNFRTSYLLLLELIGESTYFTNTIR